MIEEECNCRFVQSEVKIRVPVQNIKSYDVIYRIPEPFLISNIDDKTAFQACPCLYHKDIFLLWDDENFSNKNLKYLRNSIHDSMKINTLASNNSSAIEWVSFMPNKRDVYLTSKGKDALDKYFQKSSKTKEAGSLQGLYYNFLCLNNYFLYVSYNKKKMLSNM